MKVSIVMACYNHKQYIKDAIRSILRQTHKNWELVVVDDHSTDTSLATIQALVTKTGIQEKTTTISHAKNKGYGASLREAIERSTGEVVVVLDSDDALATDTALATCAKVHEKYPGVSMTYSNYKVCYEDLKPKSIVETRQIREDEFYLKRGGAFTEQARPGDELNVSLKISHLKAFKRKHYDMTEGIDPSLRKTVDKDLVFKLEEVGQLKHINQFLMLYRRHTNSLAAQFGRSDSEAKKVIELARQGIYTKAVQRRKKNKRGLKIFLDGSRRSAVNRMFPCWAEMGHEVVADPKKADVQLSVVRIYTQTGLPTLLRIDGVYYDKAEDYVTRNLPISISHTQATAVVYQSHLSKMMCEKFLARRATSFYRVIYNGVSEANWKRPAKAHTETNVFSCAKWRRIKRLPELISIFQRFSQLCPNAKLHIIGPMARGTRELASPNVFYYGETNSDKIKELYQKADVHVHLCKKDSCPSNIPESIAAGVPVVTTNLCGGAAEMSLMTPGCVVVDEGTQSFEPDLIYCEPYNNITSHTETQVVSAMLQVSAKKVRTKLPKELSIEHTAKQYSLMLEKIYESS